MLNIEHPVVSAPMGLVAGAPLAAAVSARGGLGMIGGAFRGPDGLRSEIRAAKTMTDPRVGVGFISHLPEAPNLATVAIDEGISVIAHSFADPTPFVSPAHDAGVLVLCQIRTCGRGETGGECGSGRDHRAGNGGGWSHGLDFDAAADPGCR
jgi:nitronate monooxygenase